MKRSDSDTGEKKTKIYVKLKQPHGAPVKKNPKGTLFSPEPLKPAQEKPTQLEPLGNAPALA